MNSALHWSWRTLSPLDRQRSVLCSRPPPSALVERARWQWRKVKGEGILGEYVVSRGIAGKVVAVGRRRQGGKITELPWGVFP